MVDPLAEPEPEPEVERAPAGPKRPRGLVALPGGRSGGGSGGGGRAAPGNGQARGGGEDPETDAPRMARTGGPRFLDPFARGGKALSDREAKQMLPDLVEALGEFADRADELISATNRRGAEAIIWSTMDEDDLATLARVWLKLGKRSAIVAQSARGLVESYDYYLAGIIVGQRFVQTGQFYLTNGVGLPPSGRKG